MAPMRAAVSRSPIASNGIRYVEKIESLTSAVKTLDAVLDRVAGEYEEVLAPAIPRVWGDEIEDLRRDLSIWVHKLVDAGAWRPKYSL